MPLDKNGKEFNLGKNHEPFIKVPKGGSSCLSCKYLKPSADGGKCTEKNFIEWYGTDTLPTPLDSYCSDWYEPISTSSMTEEKLEMKVNKEVIEKSFDILKYKKEGWRSQKEARETIQAIYPELNLIQLNLLVELFEQGKTIDETYLEFNPKPISEEKMENLLDTFKELKGQYLINKAKNRDFGPIVEINYSKAHIGSKQKFYEIRDKEEFIEFEESQLFEIIDGNYGADETETENNSPEVDEHKWKIAEDNYKVNYKKEEEKPLNKYKYEKQIEGEEKLGNIFIQKNSTLPTIRIGTTYGPIILNRWDLISILIQATKNADEATYGSTTNEKTKERIKEMVEYMFLKD